MRRFLPLFLISSLAFAACDKKAEDKKDDKKEEAKKDDKKGDDKADKKGDKDDDKKGDKKEDGLVFKAKAPAVGDKVEEKETSEMKMALDIDAGGKKQTVDMTMNESMVKKTEVLAVDGKAVTKEKVTYVEKKKTETEGGKEKKKPKSPIDGKTYILEAKDGKTLVTDEKGKKVPKDEEEAVLKANRAFGKPDPVLTGLPDKAIKVGDKVEKLAKALEEHFKDMDESKEQPEISDVEVKLESIDKDGEAGVFTIQLTMSSPKSSKEPFSMKIPLKGTMKVRAKDGFTTEVNLKGPLTMEGTDPKFKLSAKGDMKLSITNTQ